MRVSIKQNLQRRHAGQLLHGGHREAVQIEAAELSSELTIGDLPAAGRSRPSPADRRR